MLNVYLDLWENYRKAEKAMLQAQADMLAYGAAQATMRAEAGCLDCVGLPVAPRDELPERARKYLQPRPPQGDSERLVAGHQAYRKKYQAP